MKDNITKKGELHVYTCIYGKLASLPYMEVHTWTYFIFSSTVSLCTSRTHLFKQHPSRRKIHTTVAYQESFVQSKLALYPGAEEGGRNFVAIKLMHRHSFSSSLFVLGYKVRVHTCTHLLKAQQPLKIFSSLQL